MILEELVKAGRAGGALVAVRKTGRRGRIVRTMAGSTAMVVMGEAPLLYNDPRLALMYGLAELELLEEFER